MGLALLLQAEAALETVTVRSQGRVHLAWIVRRSPCCTMFWRVRKRAWLLAPANCPGAFRSRATLKVNKEPQSSGFVHRSAIALPTCSTWRRKTTTSTLYYQNVEADFPAKLRLHSHA